MWARCTLRKARAEPEQVTSTLPSGLRVLQLTRTDTSYIHELPL